MYCMKIYLFLLGMALACQTALAQLVTETFGTGTDAFSIDFVTIGNPGNASDNPLGAVAYTYNLGKYEVSRELITKANAVGGLNITMSDLSDYGGNGVNRPATGVSWYEAAKFVNFLNTSKGYQAAYNFDGSGNFQLWGAGQYSGTNQYRHKDAIYVLPTIDEWYKAAYGSPGGTWYDYPTGSDSAPSAVASGIDPGTAVFSKSGPADINNAGGLSAYGTMAQGGNAWEWTETAYDGVNNTASEDREMRGGYWGGGSLDMGSFFNDPISPTSEEAYGIPTGFRVATVPEPSTGLLVALGLGGLLLQRRKTGSL